MLWESDNHSEKKQSLFDCQGYLLQVIRTETPSSPSFLFLAEEENIEGGARRGGDLSDYRFDAWGECASEKEGGRAEVGMCWGKR